MNFPGLPNNNQIHMKPLAIIIGLILFPLTTLGQDVEPKISTYWLDGGTGAFTSANGIEGLPTVYASLNYLPRKTFYKLRYILNQEFNLFGSTPMEVYHNVGILFGTGASRKIFQVQVAGGAGVTGGIKRGDFIKHELLGDKYENDRFITFSIPVEFDVLFKPIKFAGAGVSLFADLNMVNPTFGFAVKLAFGKLR
jgi:hypothetical protein